MLQYSILGSETSLGSCIPIRSAAYGRKVEAQKKLEVEGTNGGRTPAPALHTPHPELSFWDCQTPQLHLLSCPVS